jgi:hypothetical protein
LFVLLSHSQTQILSDGMRLLRKKFCFSNWPLTLLPFQSDYIHSSMWSTVTLGIPSISILFEAVEEFYETKNVNNSQACIWQL